MVKLSLQSRLQDVSLAGVLTRAIGSESGLSEAVGADVELAVVEALTNIVQHGGLGEDSLIEIAYESAPDRLVVEITDHGQEIPAALLTGSENGLPDFSAFDLMSLPESGMGLPMIRLAMDEVVYESAGGRNRLRLVKRFGAA